MPDKESIKYKVSEETLVMVLNYLYAQPYNQVNQLVIALEKGSKKLPGPRQKQTDKKQEKKAVKKTNEPRIKAVKAAG